jgi:hypothetical protein
VVLHAQLLDVCGGGALNLVPGGGLRIESQTCGLGATHAFDLGVGAARVTGGGDNSVVGAVAIRWSRYGIVPASWRIVLSHE